MTDLRLAFRRLASAPSFSLTVVLTLALGAGANTLVFSAVTSLLLKPLPFDDAERIAWAFASAPAEPGFGKVTEAEANALTTAVGVDAAAVIGDKGLVRASGAGFSRWHGIWVTTGISRVLGIRPAAGRLLGPEDFPASASPAMLISYSRWQKDFAGDPSVIGREIRFEDNKSFMVVGVLPADLAFPMGRPPQSGNGSGFVTGEQDFWVLGHNSASLPGGVAIVRVRNDRSVRSAQQELDTLIARPRQVSLVSLRDQVLGSLGKALPFVQGFAALVFLIACVNVAGLVLVRATTEANQSAIRLALGARVSDLVRGSAAEALWLAGAGTVLALALAALGRAALSGALPSSTAVLNRIDINAPVVVFAAGLGAVAALLMALLPSVAAARPSLSGTLGRASHRQVAGSRSPVLRTLVIVQIALSTVLLFGGSMLGTSVYRLLNVDAGYRAEGVVAADVMLYVPNSQPVFRQLHARLRALPGVQAVGLIHSTPLTGKWTIQDPMGVIRDGIVVETPLVAGNFVAFDYFAAMRIPIVAGRDFAEADYFARKPMTVIINDVAARRYFPGVNPVGQHVHLGSAPREIVGVVAGTRDMRLDAAPEPQFYQPMFFGTSQIVVRTSGNTSALVDTMRREIAAADPRFMILDVAPLESILAETITEQRAAARLVIVFAGVALVLAFVGLYGVMQFIVSTRRRECGVRLALGAPRSRLVCGVIAHGLALAAIGIAGALVLAVSLARAARHLLFDVAPADPVILAATGIAMLVVATLACARPAWRAASVDPALALRPE
jgi:predicted permease